jgi:hypothetical protein
MGMDLDDLDAAMRGETMGPRHEFAMPPPPRRQAVGRPSSYGRGGGGGALVLHVPDWLRVAPRVVLPLLLIGSALAVVRYALQKDPPQPGLTFRTWTTLALGAFVLGVLMRLYRSFGPRLRGRFVMTLSMCLATALLVMLLMPVANLRAPQAAPRAQATAAPTGRQTARPAQAATGDVGCPPVAHFIAWVPCIWTQATEAAKKLGQPPPTTAPARAAGSR